MQPPSLWRPLTPSDLLSVKSIADRVHPAFPEDLEVFAERLRLYPAGMWLLQIDGQASGYLVSHPWRSGSIPALNARLRELPELADIYYLHDLALLPAARGKGSARQIVEQMVKYAKNVGFASICLVAVNGSSPFWRGLGFDVGGAPAGKLESYGRDARMMIRKLVA